jgi:acetyl esterase/lipase
MDALPIPDSMNPADTDDVYAPLHASALPPGVTVARNFAYGPDARHRLDLAHSQDSAARPKPVFVFVHGGGFTSGERQRPGTPFHDNVMRWAVHEGMVGVNLTYRLAPEHAWPAGGADVLAAMGWIRENIARWGGDPARTVLFGHSAGASHAAEALAQAQEKGGESLPAAAVLLSGIYAPADVAPTPGRQAYFGTDASLYETRASVSRLAAARLPLLIAHSEREPREFADQARALGSALERQGSAPQCEVLQSHNHFSPVMSLGSTDVSFGRELAGFVQRSLSG